MAGENFELLYEGPQDDTEKTLRMIKGAFVVELEFPVTDVQRFLTGAPICILTSSNQNELERAYAVLEKAGAKMSISQINEIEGNAEVSNESLPVDPDTIDLMEPGAMEALPEMSMTAAVATPPHAVVPSVEDEKDVLELHFDEPAPVENTKPEVLAATEPLSNLGALELSLDGDSEATKSDPQPTKQEVVKPTAAPSLNVSTLEFALEPIEEPGLSDASNREPEKTAGSLVSPVETVPQEMTLDFDEEVAETHSSQSHTPPTLANSKSTSSPIAPAEVSPSKILMESVPLQEVKPVLNKEIISQSVSEGVSFTPVASAMERLTPLPELRKHAATTGKSHHMTIVGVLGTLFIAVNYFVVLPMLTGQPAVQAVFDIKQAFEQEKAQKALLAEEQTRLANIDHFVYTLDKSFSGFSIFAQTDPFVESPDKISFSITTPEPPPLTKEEIVAGVKPHNWLSRIELKNIPLRLDQKVSLQAAAFTQVNGNPLRVAVPLSVLATLSSDKSAFLLSITSENAPGTKPKIGLPPVLLTVENERATVHLDLNLELRKVLAD